MSRTLFRQSRAGVVRSAALALLLAVAVASGPVTPAVAEGRRDPVALVPHGIASDVNERGVVVGWYDLEDGRHGFRWSHGRTTDLGIGRAEAVNDAGVVVGELEGRATLWDRDGVAHDLGAGPNSVATDINRRGTVVGHLYIDGQPNVRGFVFEPGAAAPDVLPPSPTAPPAGDHPMAINARGTIAGIFVDDGMPRPIVWRAGTHEPEVLHETAESSDVQGINERGTIVGSTHDALGYKAVIWRAGDHRQVEVGEPGTHSLGRGINDRGQVVGVQYLTGTAYRWDPGPGRTTALPGLGDGYDEATAINDRGVTVGYSNATETGPMYAVVFGRDPASSGPR